MNAAPVAQRRPAVAPPDSNLGRWVWLAIPLGAFGVFVSTAIRLNTFIVDDVFISLRYGRHLLDGLGLIYNRGERVEGYTNFLWTLLAAPACVVPIGVVPYLRLLNGLCAVLAAWQAGILLQELAVRSRPARSSNTYDESLPWLALGAAMFLLTPAIWISAAEGLETMLFTLLLLITVNRVIADRNDARIPPAGLAVAALAMTRPDGAEFIAWAVLAAVLTGRPSRYTARMLLVAVALFGAYWLARSSWYGQWFPNTFYAKHGGSRELLERGWDECRRLLWIGGGFALLLAAPALFSRGRRLAWAVLLAVALRILFELWSGGAQLGRYRFLVPAIPLLQALAVTGSSCLAGKRSQRLALACASAVLLLLPGWFAYPYAEENARSDGVGLWNAHRRLGEDLAAHTLPEAVIACSDAGLAPLLCDRTNVDVTGLNDAHMAHLPGRFLERVDVDYLLGRRPDLIVLLGKVQEPHSRADLWIAPDGALFEDERFREGYEYSRNYEFNRGYFLLVYRRHNSTAAPADFWGGERSGGPVRPVRLDVPAGGV